jgi:XTP/dITP diphosphohydrolase
VPAELDGAQLGVVTEEEWRAHWPTDEQLTDEPDTDAPGQAGDSEPVAEEDESEDQDSSVEPQ